MTEKQTVRANFLEIRKRQSKETKRVADQGLAKNLNKLLSDLSLTEDILAFRPMAAEADPFLGELPKACLFPRVDGIEMSCHRVRDSSEFISSKLGFMEPRPDAPEVPAASLKAVLVPGVAFDRRGTRLGFGKGHYDRFLKKVKRGTPRIGVAYAFQVSSRELPREEWDEAMDWIVSDAFILNVESGARLAPGKGKD